MSTTRYTEQEWRAEAERRFGSDAMDWAFVCPACGHVATVRDYRDAGATSRVVGFSCVGRYKDNPRQAFADGPGPCDYAGGGLIELNPVVIRFDPVVIASEKGEEGEEVRYFDFAPGAGGEG